MLASNLGLRNDELKRVTAVGLVDGVLKDTDSPNDISSYLDFVGEVRRIGNNFGGLGCKFHALASFVTFLHGCFNTRHFSVLVVQDFVNAGVEHIGTAVDSRQTCKTLWQFSKTVERIDIRRFSVASHGVDVQADTVDTFNHSSSSVDIIVRWV